MTVKTVRETTVNLSTAELQLLVELLSRAAVPVTTAKVAAILYDKISSALEQTNGT